MSRSLVAISGLVLSVTFASCSNVADTRGVGARTRDQGSTAPRSFPPGGIHAGGLQAPLTEAELDAAAPVIVLGQVLSRKVVALRDDPYLPPGWENDPEESVFVSKGAKRIKWRVAVSTWVKGDPGPPEIWVVRGTDGEEIGGGGSALPPGQLDPVSGQHVRLWLEPEPWFQQDHYVLVRAKDETT